MTQIFLHTSSSIQSAVNRETSYIAERSESFENIVYDEEYFQQFRDHFLEARANIIEATLAYSKNVEMDDTYFDITNFDDEKDFAITLEFPDDHIKQTHQPMLVKMREYLISYIVYRWLENKIPEIAAVYLNKAEGALSGIKSLCEKRISPLRRRGMYF